MGELHLNGLRYAREYGVDKCYQFDLFEPPFQEHFKAVALFDVLEHLEDDKKALQNIHSILKPDGQIVLTVPVHQWLWNRDDRIACHKKRYTKKDLCEVVKSAGFKTETIEFFFCRITPLLLLRRFLKPDHSREVTIE